MKFFHGGADEEGRDVYEGDDGIETDHDFLQSVKYALIIGCIIVMAIIVYIVVRKNAG